MKRLLLAGLLLLMPLAGIPLASAAVSVSELAHNSSLVASASIASDPVAPASNNLVLVVAAAFIQTGNGPGPVSTITGNGLAYVQIASQNYGDIQGTGRTGRLEIWRGMGVSPSSGPVTVTWGTSPTKLGVIVSQASGVNTSGTNGSGAVGISCFDASGGGLSTVATCTMGTFGSSSNGTYAAVVSVEDFVMTPGGGMAKLSGPNLARGEWAAGNVSPVQLTYSVASRWGIIGVEIIVP